MDGVITPEERRMIEANKCNKSPIGAHHWIHQYRTLWECKYCLELTNFEFITYKSRYGTRERKEKQYG